MTFSAPKNTILPDATVGVPYEFGAVADGVPAAAALVLSAGSTQTGKDDPTTFGLTYVASRAMLSGTPTKAGKLNLSVKLSDGTSTADNVAYTLTVHPGNATLAANFQRAWQNSQTPN